MIHVNCVCPHPTDPKDLPSCESSARSIQRLLTHLRNESILTTSMRLGMCLFRRETREPRPWSRQSCPKPPHRFLSLLRCRVQCLLPPCRDQRSLPRPSRRLRRFLGISSVRSAHLPPPPVDTIPAVPATHASRRGKTAAELYSNRGLFTETSFQRFSNRRSKRLRAPKRQRSSPLLPSTTSPYH